MLNYDRVLDKAGEHYAAFRKQKNLDTVSFIRINDDQVKAIALAIIDEINNHLDIEETASRIGFTLEIPDKEEQEYNEE